jgi:PAS domain S-box-containing protein
MSQEKERTITSDRDGVIRQWGREAENVFGYTAEEALGRKVDLIIPPVLHARHWRGFNKAIGTGQMKRPGKTLKIPAVHKSGGIIPFRGSLVLKHTDSGEVDGAVATVLGRGPAWRGSAWRVVLAPLKLAQLVQGRVRRSTE